jgi:hydroxymethylbilane synthase
VTSSLKLGTRRSTLARYQAHRVKQVLIKRYPHCNIDSVPIQSEGDIDKTTPLSEMGGKGVFIKSLEQALMAGEIDVAVHSMKDVTTELAPGSAIAAYLTVDSPRDALCMAEKAVDNNKTDILGCLPTEATVATGSLRRKAQLLHHRPDLKIVPIRGNVETRLQTLENTDTPVDAVMLSEAGLLRLGLQDHIALSLDPHDFVPAPGQGVIIVQIRSDDRDTHAMIQSINDFDQASLSQLELDIVRRLGFDCRYPLGLYAQRDRQKYTIDAFNADPQSLTGHYFKFTLPLDYSATDLDEIVIELML